MNIHLRKFSNIIYFLHLPQKKAVPLIVSTAILYIEILFNLRM